MSFDNEITSEFIGRWARGLTRAARLVDLVPPEGLSHEQCVKVAAAIVLEVMGANFINTGVLNEAVKLASPDPLKGGAA